MLYDVIVFLIVILAIIKTLSHCFERMRDIYSLCSEHLFGEEHVSILPFSHKHLSLCSCVPSCTTLSENNLFYHSSLHPIMYFRLPHKMYASYLIYFSYYFVYIKAKGNLINFNVMHIETKIGIILFRKIFYVLSYVYNIQK